MPLLLVKLPKNEKDIFQIKEVNGLIAIIETLKNKTDGGQCFRCQKFNHSAKNCHAEPKCVKCGQNHLSVECKFTINDKTICANCGKNHPASYKGCEAFPKPKKTVKSNVINKNKHTNYADAVKNKNDQTKTRFQIKILQKIQTKWILWLLLLIYKQRSPKLLKWQRYLKSFYQMSAPLFLLVTVNGNYN